MVDFGEFFENLKLAVKQCYQTGQFYESFLSKTKILEFYVFHFWRENCYGFDNKAPICLAITKITIT